MDGSLEKKRRGVLSKGYVKRFYRLQNTNLIEYKDLRDQFDANKGTRIDLRETVAVGEGTLIAVGSSGNIVTGASDENLVSLAASATPPARKKPLNFYVQTTRRVYNFRAPSAVHKAMWLGMLSVFHGRATLGDHVPLEVSFVLKMMVTACVKHLIEYGTKTEGLFRLPTRTQAVDLLYRSLMEQVGEQMVRFYNAQRALAPSSSPFVQQAQEHLLAATPPNRTRTVSPDSSPNGSRPLPLPPNSSQGGSRINRAASLPVTASSLSPPNSPAKARQLTVVTRPVSSSSSQPALLHPYPLPTDSDINLVIDPNVSVHTVATVLRRCFREMPETVLTNALYGEFVQENRAKTMEHEQFARLIERLPPNNYEVLHALSFLLFQICQNHAETQATVKDLSLLFAPDFLRKHSLPTAALGSPPPISSDNTGVDPVDSMYSYAALESSTAEVNTLWAEMNAMLPFFSAIINHYDTVFERAFTATALSQVASTIIGVDHSTVSTPRGHPARMRSETTRFSRQPTEFQATPRSSSPLRNSTLTDRRLDARIAVGNEPGAAPQDDASPLRLTEQKVFEHGSLAAAAHESRAHGDQFNEPVTEAKRTAVSDGRSLNAGIDAQREAMTARAQQEAKTYAHEMDDISRQLNELRARVQSLYPSSGADAALLAQYAIAISNLQNEMAQLQQERSRLVAAVQRAAPELSLDIAPPVLLTYLQTPSAQPLIAYPAAHPSSAPAAYSHTFALPSAAARVPVSQMASTRTFESKYSNEDEFATQDGKRAGESWAQPTTWHESEEKLAAFHRSRAEETSHHSAALGPQYRLVHAASPSHAMMLASPFQGAPSPVKLLSTVPPSEASYERSNMTRSADVYRPHTLLGFDGGSARRLNFGTSTFQTEPPSSTQLYAVRTPTSTNSPLELSAVPVQQSGFTSATGALSSPVLSFWTERDKFWSSRPHMRQLFVSSLR